MTEYLSHTFSLENGSNIPRHFFDFCVAEGLYVTQSPNIRVGDEADDDIFSVQMTHSNNTIDVLLALLWKIVVNNQRHLLDMNTAGENIRSDKHTASAGTELAHHGIMIRLIHVTVEHACSELTLAHVLRQPLDLSPRVRVDNRLGDRACLIEIAQGVKLPLLLSTAM